MANGDDVRPNYVSPDMNPPPVPPPDISQQLPPGVPGQSPPLVPTAPQSGGNMSMPGAGMPNIIQLLAGAFKPQQGQVTPGQGPQRPNSRLDVFENFLGNFLTSFAAGMGQSGQRGAEGKGFAAAVQQPYQRAIQQQQLGMQQRQVESQEGLRAAQEEFNRNRATAFDQVPMQVTGADGKLSTIMVNRADVGKVQQAIERGQAQRDVAETKGQFDIKKTAMAQGTSLPVDQTIANLIGKPEMANQPATKATWDNIKKSLDSKGYKLADLGQDGAWIIDRVGNKINRVGDSPTMARGMGYAYGRAMYTPFETVLPGTNTPTTISNLQALQTGAPKVPIGAQTTLGGRYALFNDAYGILDKINGLVDTTGGQAPKVNLDDKAVASRVAAGYAAIKDPASGGLAREALSNILARQPINNQLKENERELVLTMAQGKAAGTGLRSILGQAGTNEMQQRLDSALMPGPQGAASIAALKQQIQATRALLDRVSVGQPQVGLNAPGTPTALPGNKPAKSKVDSLVDKYATKP